MRKISFSPSLQGDVEAGNSIGAPIFEEKIGFSPEGGRVFSHSADMKGKVPNDHALSKEVLGAGGILSLEKNLGGAFFIACGFSFMGQFPP